MRDTKGIEVVQRQWVRGHIGARDWWIGGGDRLIDICG